jgi:hypothetical protein
VVLSKRERYIAIGVAAAVGLLLLDRFVLTPYAALRDSIATEQHQVMDSLTNADLLFTRQRQLRKVWTQMEQGGLKTDPSQAESQALGALLEWTRSAGVNLAALTPERTVQQEQFRVISFSVKVTGPMAAMSRLLWAMESATIPVRVTELRINPQREGVDDLSMQMSVSTLCLMPQPAGTAKGH